MAVTDVFWGFSSCRGLLIKASLGKSCIGTLEGGDGFLKLKICQRKAPSQGVWNYRDQSKARHQGRSRGSHWGQGCGLCVGWAVAVQGSVPKTLSRAPQAFPRAPLCSERWMPLAKMRALMLDHFGSDIFGDLWQYKSLLAPPAMTVLS